MWERYRLFLLSFFMPYLGRVDLCNCLISIDLRSPKGTNGGGSGRYVPPAMRAVGQGNDVGTSSPATAGLEAFTRSESENIAQEGYYGRPNRLSPGGSLTMHSDALKDG